MRDQLSGEALNEALFEGTRLQFQLDEAKFQLFPLLEAVAAERSWAALLPEVKTIALRQLCQVGSRSSDDLVTV